MSEGSNSCLSPRESGQIESRLPYFKENIHRLNEIAQQLENIADKIDGPVPPQPCDPCAEGKNPTKESIIYALDQTTSGTQSATDRLQSALNRLRELI